MPDERYVIDVLVSAFYSVVYNIPANYSYLIGIFLFWPPGPQKGGNFYHVSLFLEKSVCSNVQEIQEYSYF